MGIRSSEVDRLAREQAKPVDKRRAERTRGEAASDSVAFGTEAAEALAGSFSVGEVDKLLRLNQRLYAAFGRATETTDTTATQAALRVYLETRTGVGRRTRSFGIANHRVFRDRDRLIVPYALGGTLFVYAADDRGSEIIAHRCLPRGTIFTDAFVLAAAGARGEVVDIDREIYEFDATRTPDIHLNRVRDVVALLQRLNRCGSRHEAVYYLRVLVSRLCASTFQGFFSAKNLQPEVRKLNAELVSLLDGPFAYRLRLPIRILARKVSGLVSRPNLIDELWHDTIDLAEVHVRGSAITNELRRSAHHALGDATLKLARAYNEYLDTGDVERLPAELRDRVTATDEEARGRAEPRATVQRIVEALDKLLGGSQIITRLQDWEESYTGALLRCESGSSLHEEVEATVVSGIRAGNRWVYHHHLRTLLSKADQGAWAEGAESFRKTLQVLQAERPGDPSFDGAAAEAKVRACVDAFVERILADHQERLLRALHGAIATYRSGGFFRAFVEVSELRDAIEGVLEQRAFPEQRYLLYQLDCLLEEMGFFALRHVASSYEESGLRLDECLRVIHMCAANLSHDGLFSRELWDRTVILLDPVKSRAEIVDVLESVQRNYHQIVHRVSVAYDMMGTQLELDDDEIRAIQGNFQRYLHDLNSMAHYTDLARAHIQSAGAQGSEDPAAETRATVATPRGCYDIVHLSHTDDIRARVESRDESENLQDRYGGKGSGLIYLSYLGIPTRDGFILPTTVPRCREHRDNPERLERKIIEHLRILEEDISRDDGTLCRYGQADNPLLLAVRGGSVFTLPGMLSTVVFVGINDEIAVALARDDAWYAYDAYRRFLVSYAGAAWGLNLEKYNLVEEAKRRHGVRFKEDLPAEALSDVTEASKRIIQQEGFGDELDEVLADPERQLIRSVHAVFHSWERESTRRYRDIKGMSHTWQTAAIVQQMASGNRQNAGVKPGMDEAGASLTGVIMQTRMTPLGFRTFTGDIKFSASGDDLVGGLTEASSLRPVDELKAFMPMLERRLNHIDAKVRRFRGTDPEIEFTVDRGRLSVLQTRMAHVGPREDTSKFEAAGEADLRGIGIRGGAFRGLVAFDDRDIEEMKAELARRIEAGDGAVDGVLLVLENPTPAEIPLILAADALVTATGGSTSHAAVAIHAIEDKPYCAVLSAAGLRVKTHERRVMLCDEGGRPRHTLSAGDVLSIHGHSGEVYAGSQLVRGVKKDR